jgi:hypothetical protein
MSPVAGSFFPTDVSTQFGAVAVPQLTTFGPPPQLLTEQTPGSPASAPLGTQVTLPPSWTSPAQERSQPPQFFVS